MAGQRGASTAAEQREAVVEPLGQSREGEGPEAGGGELDGEGPAIESTADATSMTASAGPSGSKPGCTARARSPKSLTASAGTRPTTGIRNSPGTPRGSRLVATTRRPGSAPTRAWARAAASSMTCSQLSRTMRRERPVRCRAMSSAVDPEGWSSPRAGPEAPRTAAAAGATAAGSVTPASSTNQAPPECWSRRRAAAATARRVLPTPPGPINVTKRLDSIASSTCSSSVLRPRKLLSGSGRLPISDGIADGRAGTGCFAVRVGSWSRMRVSRSRKEDPGSIPSSSTRRSRISVKARSASAWRPAL